MNGDMFCYFHIVHLAKHIMTGGCGIRPILDLCFVEKNMKTTEKLHQFLEEGKMENAYSIATRLKDVWFFGKEHTNESRRFGSYVITGGVYGNLENVVTVKKMNRGNAFKYALSRIFIPYNKLIYRYPQLENRKYLLPYYEVKRWLDLLLGGRGKFAYNEFKANNALTRDKVDEIRQMKSDFGI